MLSTDDIKDIRSASLRIRVREDRAIKPDKFNNLARFILDQIKAIFLDASGKPKTMIEIIFSIRKIIRFVKDLIGMIKSELA